MIKAVIIDDEKLAIDELSYLLSDYNELEIVETFTDAVKALQYLSVNKVDLIFMDIHMPRLNGMDLAEVAMNLDYEPKVVFISAYDVHAVQAFEINALDYLLKPTTKERLKKTMTRIISAFDLESTSHLAQYRGCISIYKNGVYRPVKLEDISLVSAHSGMITFYTKNEKFSVNGTLSDIESKLDEHFFRCHRSYIVNLEYIDLIEPHERSYLLKVKYCNELIPVSRSNIFDFKYAMSIQ